MASLVVLLYTIYVPDKELPKQYRKDQRVGKITLRPPLEPDFGTFYECTIWAFAWRKNVAPWNLTITKTPPVVTVTPVVAVVKASPTNSKPEVISALVANPPVDESPPAPPAAGGFIAANPPILKPTEKTVTPKGKEEEREGKGAKNEKLSQRKKLYLNQMKRVEKKTGEPSPGEGGKIWGLFNSEGYQSFHADLSPPQNDPWLHFKKWGSTENRRMVVKTTGGKLYSGFLDEENYFEMNGMIRPTCEPKWRCTALKHYLKFGQKDNLKVPLFDPREIVGSKDGTIEIERGTGIGIIGHNVGDALGVPLLATSQVASSPVASSPVASSPVATSPVASSPVASSPVASSPVVSSPVASSQVASSPVASSPVVHPQVIPYQSSGYESWQ